MKTKRFFAFFLCLVLSAALWIPVAAAEDGTPDPIPVMEVAAQAAFLVDGDTGEQLYAKNENKALYPSSLTMVMTALLTLEAVEAKQLALDDELIITATALSTLGGYASLAEIKQGEKISVKNLLYCMLVVSSTEAANQLAERIGGTEAAFVELMNQRAKELGCKNTNFVNPTGNHDDKHVSSAYDLYLITREAMKHPLFMTVCDTADIRIPATNLSKERLLYTTNYLLSNWRAIGYRNKEAHGVKAGSSDQAGHCLITTGERKTRSLICVILGAEKATLSNGKTQVQSFSEASRLLDWGFDNFSHKTILAAKEMLDEVPVLLSQEVASVAVHPAEDLQALLPNDVDLTQLKRTVTLKEESVMAPIAAGQVLGSVTVSYNEQEYGTTDLLALNDVSASRLLVIQYQLSQFFSSTWVRVLAMLLLLAVVALFVWISLTRKHRSRYGRRRSGGGSSGYRGGRRR